MPEQKIKILFVDDDSFLRRVYETELSEQNFEVILAVDGQDGLDKARITDPNLIILDMIMPKKNGFEVLTELQSDPKTSHIPVIILSNLGQAADKQKGMDLGAADYLVKDSTTLGVIVEKIEHILHSKTSSYEARLKSHQAALKEAKVELKPEEVKTSSESLAKQIFKKNQPVENPLTVTSTLMDNNQNVDIQFCPNCGAHLKSNYKFCPKCGYNLVNNT